jgi:serine protease AprX
MKRIVLFLLFTFSTVHAQEDAWVYFNDKPDAEFYLANPLEMLSQKSLDRRANQGIALDVQDVPVSSTYIAYVESVTGVTIMARSKWLNALHIRGSEQNIRALTNFNFVNRIDFADNSLDVQGRREPIDKPVTNNKTATANKVQETQVTYNYGSSFNQIEMLNGQVLHQQNFTGTGKTIAIMDNGFPGVPSAQPFARLNQNGKIEGGYNFVQRGSSVYNGGTHGTLVLSTMGGYTENQLVGTAPDASYYLFVTEDVAAENPVEESYWVEAAEMADSLGVDVINTSLGYYAYDNPAYSYTYADANGTTSFITRGANVAFTRGMMLVTSAGNSGATGNPNISVPADAFNTLSVGAVDATEQYAYFSSIGPTADGRVKPDVMAKGLAATLSTTDGTITTASGTSFSGPITAGMVACLWQALPDKTNSELLQIIKESADRYTNPDNLYGYGIPDFNLALRNALGLNDVKPVSFLLYPNPAKNILKVQFPDKVKNGALLLYNSLGQKILERTIAEGELVSVEDIPYGIYVYYISGGGKVQSGKIVKE